MTVMDQAQLDDLKQFITATVSQSEARLEERLGGRIDRLEQKMDDGFAGIAEAIEQIHDHNAETDRRLTKLEQRHA